MEPLLPLACGAVLEGLTIGIVGCGAVGRAFAVGLARRGAIVSLWSRRSESVHVVLRAVERFAPGAATEVPFEDLAAGDVVLLCVHDDAVRELAEHLALEAAVPRVVLHTCGYFGAEILAPLKAAGAACGKLHPLLSMPRNADEDPPGAGREDPLEGGHFCLGGDPEALATARRIVAALHGHELLLKPGESSDRLYHAAAALSSGGYVAVFDTAIRALARTLDLEEGAAERAARSALEALMISTDTNLRSRGTKRALSGPVARGAEGIVAGHLEALGGMDPDAEELYRVLTRIMKRLVDSGKQEG